MGKLRARTKDEINKRYEDIINAAKDLFMKMEYEDISLAIIAKELNITRPSLYNYFDSKEALFLELCKQGYLGLADELNKEFYEHMDINDFCSKLCDVLMEDELFLKLMSLHQTVMETKAGKEAMEEFKKSTLPFFKALENIIAIEFPNATVEKKVLFATQINVLLNTVHAYISTPVEQQEVMKKLGTLGGNVPKAKDFYTSTLKSLATALI